MLITGEGISEFAARIGNLMTCAARAEVKLINRADGKVLLATRITTRAVDLSEQVAAKTALQKAGRAVGVQILEHFAKDASRRRSRKGGGAVKCLLSPLPPIPLPLGRGLG